MIDWLNQNSGLIMAILTLVYAVTTILIWWSGHKATQTAQQQLKESKEQTFEISRGLLIAKIYEVDKNVILTFENIGKSIVKDATITISKEFVDIFSKTSDLLSNMNAQRHYFAPAQKVNFFLYKLCSRGNDTTPEKLKDTPAKVQFEYETLGRKVKEEIEININPLVRSFYGMTPEEIFVGKIVTSIDQVASKLKTKKK